MNGEYCIECGLRRADMQQARLYRFQQGVLCVRIYMSSSTEMICFGHTQEREPVPLAFYHAFDNDTDM